MVHEVCHVERIAQVEAGKRISPARFKCKPLRFCRNVSSDNHERLIVGMASVIEIERKFGHNYDP